MGNEELEFENRRKTIDSLKADLRATIDKYNLGKIENDQYNGMEEYIGTDYYFTINGKPFYGQTIPEILNEVVSID